SLRSLKRRTPTAAKTGQLTLPARTQRLKRGQAKGGTARLSVTAADWEKIEAAFDRLLALPPADRPAELDRIAGPDEKLRRELESLLAHVDGDDPLLDQPLL